ncbi:MAG: hypothetical protein OXG06_03105 [Gammaproteobacteria bacterium]|nr:hypothetical protein [Gammaproteobacteria bacterium]
MQYSNLFPQTFQAAAIVEDIVGLLEPGVAVKLCRNDGVHMCPAAMVPGHDPFGLLLDRAVDDENTISQTGAFGLEQQGNHEDAVHGIELEELAPDFPVYQWVQQAFKGAAKVGVREDGLPQPVTQQGPAAVEIVIPESLVQLFKDLFGFRQLSGDDIGIDDRDIEVLFEDTGDRRLAAADAACKANY